MGLDMAHMADSVRLTTAQALVRYLANQFIDIDGNRIGQLGIVTFDDPTQLTKLESQLFQQGGAVAQPMVNPNIQQGTLEQSNANTIEMMIKMVELERMYDMNARTVNTVMNQINRAAITGILGN